MGDNAIKKKKFKEIDLDDIFFDSLKTDYPGFDKWYSKKAQNEEAAYVLYEDGIQGFLYLKEENEEDTSISPLFKKKGRLKVGTFKVNAHGTKLGERFIKIIIDEMYKNSFEEAYVTIFPKHVELIQLVERYGFKYHGKKKSLAGVENVYVKYSNVLYNDLFLDYPKINVKDNKKLLLSIYPKFHTRMFPDSKLKTETDHNIEDVSFTNSIEKIYLSGALNLDEYRKGDIVVIYRTRSNDGRGWYESVATSICVVEEIKHINEFKSYDDFLNYCIKYSVFREDELRGFWKDKKYPYLIKMLYNIALNKRPIRKQLIEDVGLDAKERWVALELTDKEFLRILELGEVNESFIVY